MKKALVTFSKNFVKCGLTGWCMEILFTSVDALRRRDLTLTGNTSLWMFPIYGMASFLKPVCSHMKDKSLLKRGSVYTLCIFTGEYLTGSFLKRSEACPWDYSHCPLNIKGLIRLDYAPLWFGAGLLFEKILCRH